MSSNISVASFPACSKRISRPGNGEKRVCEGLKEAFEGKKLYLPDDHPENS